MRGKHPTKSFCLLGILLELAVGCSQQPQKTLEKCVSRLKQLDHSSAKIDIFVKTDLKVSVPNPYDSMKSLDNKASSVRKASFKSEHQKTGSNRKSPARGLASLGGHKPSQRRDTWPGPHASAGCNVFETAWGKPSYFTKLTQDVLG